MVKYKKGPDNSPVDENGRPVPYWDIRKELLYYHALANFVRIIGHEASSLIDIGSGHCPYIQWFDWIPDRVSLDISEPTIAPGVRSIETDFLEWNPDKIYDVVLCCQVLEHIEDVERFARKLLSIGKRVLISVPHKWPAGGQPDHIHDPVTQEKVDAWFARKPNYAMLVREPFAEERLICFYNMSGVLLNLSTFDMMSIFANRPLVRYGR